MVDGCLFEGDPALCADGNPCTKDVCTVGTGCSNPAMGAVEPGYEGFDFILKGPVSSSQAFLTSGAISGGQGDFTVSSSTLEVANAPNGAALLVQQGVPGQLATASITGLWVAPDGPLAFVLGADIVSSQHNTESAMACRYTNPAGKAFPSCVEAMRHCLGICPRESASTRWCSTRRPCPQRCPPGQTI